MRVSSSNAGVWKVRRHGQRSDDISGTSAAVPSVSRTGFIDRERHAAAALPTALPPGPPLALAPSAVSSSSGSDCGWVAVRCHAAALGRVRECLDASAGRTVAHCLPSELRLRPGTGGGWGGAAAGGVAGAPVTFYVLFESPAAAAAALSTRANSVRVPVPHQGGGGESLALGFTVEPCGDGVFLAAQQRPRQRPAEGGAGEREGGDVAAACAGNASVLAVLLHPGAGIGRGLLAAAVLLLLTLRNVVQVALGGGVPWRHQGRRAPTWGRLCTAPAEVRLRVWALLRGRLSADAAVREWRQPSAGALAGSGGEGVPALATWGRAGFWIDAVVRVVSSIVAGYYAIYYAWCFVLGPILRC